MHELAICEALMRQVEAIARERGNVAVSEVVVEVGPLSGVEPRLLARAFTVARAGTCAGSAELELVHSPLEIRCRPCGHTGPAAPNRLLCERCESWQVQVVRGADLVLQRVTLESAPSPTDPANREKETSHV